MNLRWGIVRKTIRQNNKNAKAAPTPKALSWPERPDVPGGTVALSQISTEAGVRGLTGLRIGDAAVAVHLGQEGEHRLTGLPPGVRLVG
jgi:hypothetical protein